MRRTNGQLLSFAWDLGYMIAVPIVVFAIGGAWLDKRFDSSPFLLLSGIFLAILTTSLWIRSKLTDLLKKASQ